MNDDTPTTVVMTPLTRPISDAAISDSTTASMSGTPASSRKYMTNAVSAKTWPTDRSISPEIIRKTWPAAMIAVAAMKVPSVWMLAVEAKSVAVLRK